MSVKGMLSLMADKTFDIESRFPNVLFVGNGLIYNVDYTWDKVIESVSGKAFLFLHDRRGIERVPNTILTLAVTDTEDKKRRDRYMSKLSGYSYKDNEKVDLLMKMPFDAVLTTNYTYDLERSLKHNYPALSDAAKRNYSASDSSDSKYLLRTYNLFSCGPPIWHIHGEMRRRSSLILSHDEYARLVAKILEYNNKNGNRYLLEKKELKMRSWIDYFIIGNVYVLGYGFDYAEFDMWWLLGRRRREKAPIGKVYFYEPFSDNVSLKHEILKLCGVEVITLGMDFNNKSQISYEQFYYEAIEDIKIKLVKNERLC